MDSQDETLVTIGVQNNKVTFTLGNGHVLDPAVSELCMLLCTSSCYEFPCMLFIKPFFTQLRWSLSGELVERPEAAIKLPAWPLAVFKPSYHQSSKPILFGPHLFGINGLINPRLMGFDICSDLQSLLLHHILELRVKHSQLVVSIDNNVKLKVQALFHQTDPLRALVQLCEYGLCCIPDPYAEPLWSTCYESAYEVVVTDILPTLITLGVLIFIESGPDQSHIRQGVLLQALCVFYSATTTDAISMHTLAASAMFTNANLHRSTDLTMTVRFLEIMRELNTLTLTEFAGETYVTTNLVQSFSHSEFFTDLLLNCFPYGHLALVDLYRRAPQLIRPHHISYFREALELTITRHTQNWKHGRLLDRLLNILIWNEHAYKTNEGHLFFATDHGTKSKAQATSQITSMMCFILATSFCLSSLRRFANALAGFDIALAYFEDHPCAEMQLLLVVIGEFIQCHNALGRESHALERLPLLLTTIRSQPLLHYIIHMRSFPGNWCLDINILIERDESEWDKTVQMPPCNMCLSPTSLKDSASALRPTTDNEPDIVLPSLRCLLTCAICSRIIHQPMMLADCLHTFCGVCLDNQYSPTYHRTSISRSVSSSSEFRTCPVCGADVKNTQPDPVAKALLDVYLTANPNMKRSEEEINNLSLISEPSVGLRVDMRQDIAPARFRTEANPLIVAFADTAQPEELIHILISFNLRTITDLKIIVADMYIGDARYSKAELILESLMSSQPREDMNYHLAMLRLAKVRRRQAILQESASISSLLDCAKQNIADSNSDLTSFILDEVESMILEAEDSSGVNQSSSASPMVYDKGSSSENFSHDPAAMEKKLDLLVKKVQTLKLAEGEQIDRHQNDSPGHEFDTGSSSTVLSVLTNRMTDLDLPIPTNATTRVGRIKSRLEQAGYSMDHTLLDPKFDKYLPRLASVGNTEMVLFLLNEGIPVDSRDDSGRSALLLACGKGDLNLVRLLIERGAQTDLMDHEESTALHHAVAGGKLEICVLILDRVVIVDPCDNKWRTPLLLAAGQSESIDICRLLLDRHAAKEAIDEDHRTPLHVAIRHRNFEICRLLLDRGASHKATGKHRWTSLHMAVLQIQREICELLIEEDATVEERDKIMEARDEQERTALHLAVNYNQLYIIELLLDRGADHNVKDIHGLSPIDDAYRNHGRGAYELLYSRGARVSEKVLKFVNPQSRSTPSGKRPDMPRSILKNPLQPNPVRNQQNPVETEHEDTANPLGPSRTDSDNWSTQADSGV